MKVGDKVIHKLYPQFSGTLTKLDKFSATIETVRFDGKLVTMTISTEYLEKK